MKQKPIIKLQVAITAKQGSRDSWNYTSDIGHLWEQRRGCPQVKFTCREIKDANIIMWVIFVCTHLIKSYSLLFILYAFHYVGILINEMS